ncbi:lipid-A-disaccharide synthase [Verrucomicrobia bacterium SCGC AG-212-E04]|nr:lipid-A-disaccharide synthase [Verrucomicrobia bacterium SCGC AG-212-E04]
MARVLYVVAGEPSGDHHAAAVMRELAALDPELQFAGLGGPEMHSAPRADGIRDWCDQAAVVGLWEVLKKYGYFRAEYHRALAEIESSQPAAVMLVDYPGFNFRLAKALRRQGWKRPILYYISPQVWAWNRGRIPQMAKLLDLMLCIFPFEKALYEKSGLRTEFVGHPMVDALAARRTAESRQSDLVALLPGSRRREVRKIFPPMLEAARALRRDHPSLRFAAAAASPARLEEMVAARQALGWGEGDCAITVGDAHRLMQIAVVGMVASGTATVEAAYFGLPHLIAYRVAALTYVVGRMVIRVDHLGMINVLAGREIVREFIQADCTSDRLAAECAKLLDDVAYRRAQVESLAQLVLTLGPGGAARRTAEAILPWLRKTD